MNSIGANLRTLRKRRNHTQRTLAISLGVRQSTVSRWETDKDNPSSKKLAHLVQELECSYDELYGRGSVQDSGEAQLIENFRALSSQDQRKLISIAAVMAK